VAIGVGVVAEGEVEPVLHRDQVRHRVGGRAVHPDLAVVVEGHEPEGRVHDGIHDGEVEAVRLGDRPPVVRVRAAQRVDADAEARAPRDLEVHRRAEVLHVRPDEVDGPDARGGARPLEGDPPDVPVPRLEQLVRPPLDDRRDRRVGRPAVGRVVLEAAVLGRIVRRGDDDAVGEPRGAAAVVDEDGVGDDRRRHRRVALRDDHLDPVRGEHLEGRALGRLGQRVGVAAEEERAGHARAGAVLRHGLGDGEDVGLVERAAQRRATVPGCSK
jgi:hypothetical protein